MEFLQELGQQCFEIVSQLPLPLFVLPDCREMGSARWEPGGSVRKGELLK